MEIGSDLERALWKYYSPGPNIMVDEQLMPFEVDVDFCSICYGSPINLASRCSWLWTQRDKISIDMTAVSGEWTSSADWLSEVRHSLCAIRFFVSHSR